MKQETIKSLTEKLKKLEKKTKEPQTVVTQNPITEKLQILQTIANSQELMAQTHREILDNLGDMSFFNVTGCDRALITNCHFIQK